jgi:uncharacterized protein YlxP (DUF503 family)
VDRNIYVGLARLEVHIPEARSLKEKRSATRPLLERIRNRHHVLVIECGQQDLHQRAAFAVSGLSTDPVDLEARLQRVERTVHDTWSGHVLSWHVEIIQVEDVVADELGETGDGRRD